MIVKFKRFHENAVIPQKAYEGDFCYDLVAVSEEEIAPGVWKYGFGFGLQIEPETQYLKVYDENENPTEMLCIPKSMFNYSIDIRPRSSIWKTGMVLSNSVGTVDEGYTNEISAVFYHVNDKLPRYKVGEKVAQMKIGFTVPCEFRVVSELKPTERGMKGYGSSGK